MDFYRICVREVEKGPRKGEMELYPDFIVGRSQDLMVRGRTFYAVWDEAAGLWSTDEYDVQRLVDEDLDQYADRLRDDTGLTYSIRYMRSFNSGSWKQFRQYLLNVSDNHKPLNTKLTFANSDVKKNDYVSKRLPYSIVPGECPAWNELVGTFFSVEERAKIEWIIGAIITGDSKKIQKFGVFYGPPGTGKGSILKIIFKLFEGYTTTFDAKELGSSNAQFATEVFKDNPLVAIQEDGDLSGIQDNARINSIVSHELMSMNEKFKAKYTSKVDAFCLIGTNKPVKISDAKSGLLRRLIDIHPTGVTFSETHYEVLMGQTDFELGAIAAHCLQVYRKMGKQYYSGYRPLEMMFQTDPFFNFIEAYYDVFKAQDGVSLRQAYNLYKEYCADTGNERPMQQYKMREELRNYFDEFKDRAEVNGEVVRSYYSGFNANKFKAPSKNSPTWSLVIDETVSLLDEVLADQPAQPAREDEDGQEVPAKKWENVRTRLGEVDTRALHFVLVPENHVVVDFDLKDDSGAKSLERNLEAASAWPATYAELSKSGSGVHLHYIWTGDVPVAELANDHSEGIEIKTLLGKASLRRRLTKCNNVPIAELNTGLAKKEKRVLTADRIKSEKGLRDMIARNMRKEFHPSTVSSVDFIKKLLDEAYEDGLQYDVSDLKPRIIAFANNSSNQAIRSLRTVKEMKFEGKQEDEVVEPDARDIDPRVVFFDVEVYPNLFVVCWKYEDDDFVTRMINPDAQQIEALLKYKLVGFYNRRYDNHILYARYMGYTLAGLYDVSQRIINNERGSYFGEAYDLSYTDIYDFASKKQTLKKWEIELGVHHMELNLPWDQPVDEKDWDRVLEYCANDVMATEAVWKNRAQDFTARQMLAELSGLSVNQTTQNHTARIIFEGNRNPQSEFNIPDLAKEFPGYEFDRGVSTYRGKTVGEGGYVHAQEGMYDNVPVLDVASMHPNSIIQMNLFGRYTKNFKALVDARIAIKNGDLDSAREMLDGKLAPFVKNEDAADDLSYALKIVINIVYGLTAASFDNPFRHIDNIDNVVAKRGALFMIDLQTACEEKGLNVVHIKTDSIKIPNLTPEDIEEIKLFGAKYGYEFVHESTYDRFCLVNDAVYVARYGWHATKPAKVGTWETVGAQFQHPVVKKSLFSDEELELEDYVENKSVQKGAMYLDFDHPEVRDDTDVTRYMRHVGKTGRFVPVMNGGGVLYRVFDNKTYAVAGTKGFEWVEADLLTPEHDIDMRYFDGLLVEAIKQIDKFGDFEEFVG